MKYFKFGLVVLFALMYNCSNNEKNGFISIYDGHSLTGWGAVPEENSGDWSVENGIIVGTGSEDKLVYLVYEDWNLGDFELKLKYRLPGDGNTGVEIRSRVDTTGKRPFEGYHADLGHIGIGSHILGAWDFHFAERKEYPCERGKHLLIDEAGQAHYTDIPDAVTLQDINDRQWNDIHIIASGNEFKFFINGLMASGFTDLHPEPLPDGAIGLQIHDKGMTVEFKDIRLKRL